MGVDLAVGGAVEEDGSGRGDLVQGGDDVGGLALRGFDAEQDQIVSDGVDLDDALE